MKETHFFCSWDEGDHEKTLPQILPITKTVPKKTRSVLVTREVHRSENRSAHRVVLGLAEAGRTEGRYRKCL